MKLFINLPGDLAHQMEEYLDRLPDNPQDLSGHWKHFSKKALVEVKDTGVLVPTNISGVNRLGFDNEFLTRHGFRRERLRSSLSVIRTKFWDIVKVIRRGIHAKALENFARVWDKTPGAVHSDTLRGEKHIVLDRIKAYHYLNLLSPLMEERFSPQAQGEYLEVGGGNCELVGLLKTRFPRFRFWLIEIPTTIPFAFINLATWFPDSRIVLPHDISEETFATQSSNADFIFCTPNLIGKIPSDSIDVACNTHSFMEMLPETIAAYFHELRRLVKEDNIFFCCNGAEKPMFRDDAQLPFSQRVGKWAIPIRFWEYPWHPRDQDYYYRADPFFKYTYAASFQTFFTRVTRLAKAPDQVDGEPSQFLSERMEGDAQ